MNSVFTKIQKIKLKEANFRAEMKKLRKDNDEKTETITHLLLQLNSIKGGQDYEMWMTERKEKNRYNGVQ